MRRLIFLFALNCSSGPPARSPSQPPPHAQTPPSITQAEAPTISCHDVLLRLVDLATQEYDLAHSDAKLSAEEKHTLAQSILGREKVLCEKLRQEELDCAQAAENVATLRKCFAETAISPT